MIYDDLVAETLTDPLPADNATAEPRPAADEVAELPPTLHDAMTCHVCQEWLAHIREAEDS